MTFNKCITIIILINLSLSINMNHVTWFNVTNHRFMANYLLKKLNLKAAFKLI